MTALAALRQVARASSSRSIWTTAAVRSAPAKGKAPARVASILPEGTPMPGLSILKDKPDPVALADDQYPPWLWGVLEHHKGAGGAGVAAALEREAEAGAAQAGAEGGARDFAREKKRLRAQNRANIKAANYLKTT
ncbi:hypothetical protein Q5752_004996 [Cryptotrichosporon argae]